MGLKYKKGEAVVQKITPISGVITDAHIVDSDVVYEVEFDGPDGEKHSRTFTEDEIEAAVAA
jgi:hypothetical protein